MKSPTDIYNWIHSRTRIIIKISLFKTMYIQFVYNINITFYTFTDKFTEQICTTTNIMEFGNDKH